MSKTLVALNHAPSVPPVERGFPGLCCIRCHEADVVAVHLGDVTTFRCLNEACGEEFELGDVRAYLEGSRAWSLCLAWLQTAPQIET